MTISTVNNSELNIVDYRNTLAADNPYRKRVDDFWDPTAALPAHVAGKRYIATATANGWILDSIYYDNGSQFVGTVPDDGWTVFSVSTDPSEEYNWYTYVVGTGWLMTGGDEVASLITDVAALQIQADELETKVIIHGT